MVSHLASIEARFREFDALNPEVWSLFKRYVSQAEGAGLRRLSASMIVDRIRFEQMITTRGRERFKINDQFTAHYARKFRNEFPTKASMFQFRTLKGET